MTKMFERFVTHSSLPCHPTPVLLLSVLCPVGFDKMVVAFIGRVGRKHNPKVPPDDPLGGYSHLSIFFIYSTFQIYKVWVDFRR